MDKEKEVLFKGKIVRQVYSSNDYRVYAVHVDTDDYPDIKRTKYQDVTVFGEVHELGVGIEYEIKAIEENNKYFSCGSNVFLFPGGTGFRLCRSRTCRDINNHRCS